MIAAIARILNTLATKARVDQNLELFIIDMGDSPKLSICLKLVL